MGRVVAKSLEGNDVLLSLELNYKGTSDKISFTENGIRIPIFLANHVFGRKKNFFQNEKIIECSDNFYFLPYGRKFEVMVRKNSRTQTYSLYLKSTIEPLDELQRTLLRIWRGKQKYIILSLKNLQYESLVKIYALLDSIPTIDKISLEDVEFNAKLANEANYMKPFVFSAFIGILCFMNGFVLIDLLSNDFNAVKIFLWIFNPIYFVISTVGLVVYNAIKSKTEKVLRQVKIYHILSGFIFLTVNLSIFIFALNQ
jgi:hypothetical protein